MANMGEDGMKKFSELLAGAIETSQHNLFVFSPSMSYVSDEWIKADPDFWKPKPHAPPHRKKRKKSRPPASRSDDGEDHIDSRHPRPAGAFYMRRQTVNHEYEVRRPAREYSFVNSLSSRYRALVDPNGP